MCIYGLNDFGHRSVTMLSPLRLRRASFPADHIHLSTYPPSGTCFIDLYLIVCLSHFFCTNTAKGFISNLQYRIKRNTHTHMHISVHNIMLAFSSEKTNILRSLRHQRHYLSLSPSLLYLYFYLPSTPSSHPLPPISSFLLHSLSASGSPLSSPNTKSDEAEFVTANHHSKAACGDLSVFCRSVLLYPTEPRFTYIQCDRSPDLV